MFVTILSLSLILGLIILFLTYEGEEEDLTKCTEEELNSDF